MGVLRGQANRKRAENAAKNLEKIMAAAWKTEKITNDGVEKVTGVSDRQARRYLTKLVKQKKLRRFGKNRNTFYKPLR